MMHVVAQGDMVASIAYEAGLLPDTIWDHPRNAGLKRLRKDMNVLFPGDELFVPDKQPRSEAAETDRVHTFRRKAVPCRLRLQLFNVEVPRANQAFTLEVEGRISQGRADGNGVVDAWVAPGAKSGTLTIGPDHAVIHLRFGHLDPAAVDDGLVERLANLGYLRGTDAASVQSAVQAFQQRFGLAPSGSFDDDTRQLLARLHDTDALFPPDPWRPAR